MFVSVLTGASLVTEIDVPSEQRDPGVEHRRAGRRHPSATSVSDGDEAMKSRLEKYSNRI
jgi:hypothetical protein